MPLIIDQQPPAGSYITIYVDSEGCPVRTKSESAGTRSGCLVIATDSDGDCWLGFLPGDPNCPPGVSSHTSPLPTTFVNVNRTVVPGHASYLCYMLLGKMVEYHCIDDGPPVSARAEAPCRQCSRANDIGTSSCWWCSIANPC